MKKIYKKTTLIKLSYVEINHLLFLIDINRRNGIYFGNMAQFIKRDYSLERRLEDSKQQLINEL